MKITIPVSTEHELWFDHYKAARQGMRFEPQAKPAALAIEKSLGWLVHTYIDAMHVLVSAGLLKKTTLSGRSLHLKRLLEFEDYAERDMCMPRHAITKWRDAQIVHGTSTANSSVKSLSACFGWAVDQGHLAVNPCLTVKKLRHEHEGARAWTLDEIKRYLDKHKAGTPAHMWLVLSLLTACRIGDAIWLGAAQIADGQISWQPTKRGSTFVSLPVPPMLDDAIRAVDGYNAPAFVRTEAGLPYQRVTSLCKAVTKWTTEAGLSGLTAHGVRKAAAEIMAANGETQYSLMSVMSHSSPQVSAIYTRKVERKRMSAAAVSTLATALENVGHPDAKPLMLLPPN